MDITCISDLHGHYPELEGGDLLIVAGDLTGLDTVIEHIQFQIWLHEQRYDKKIVIAGDHDNRLQQLPFEAIKRQYAELGEDYLCDSGTEFEFHEPDPVEKGRVVLDTIFSTVKRFKIWGTPWTLTFDGINPHCTAFTGTEAELEAKFALIPDDIDILITHGPPLGIFDKTDRGENVGSKSLLEKARSLKNLKLFVFGHLHEGYGMITPSSLNGGAKVRPNKSITCASFPYIVNCSHVNEHYEPVNKPVRIVL